MHSLAVHSLAVVWRAGGLLFSTLVEAVVEVLPPVKANPAPAVPEWVRGLFVYRGTLIPLVDVAKLLGRTSGEDRMTNRVLVVRSGQRDGTGDRMGDAGLVGLWVESVLELDRPAYGATGSHPGFSSEASRFLGPVAETRFGTVQDVRPADLFTPEQSELLWAQDEGRCGVTYAQVQRWLSDRMSFDASLLKGAGFDSLIAERLGALRCQSEEDYVGVLEQSEEEAERLAGSIAVPETWFFRYPLSFELLVEYLSKRLREGASALRMVSVGCASGEEAYGMAMAALHAGWIADRVTIDALDRSEGALRRGRTAEYGSFSIRHEVPAWGIEFLRHEGGTISVDDRVRSMVHFQRADVLDRAALSMNGPYDVAFCRNLLIYLEADARTRLLTSIAASLAEEGLLFVGHAEQMMAVSPKMKRIDSSHAFALERVGLRPAQEERAAESVSARSAAHVPVDTRRSPIPAIAQRPIVVTKVPQRAPEATLDDARAFADAGRIRESEELIRSINARKGPTAAALELLGTLRQASNDAAGAKALFEQALYLEPARTTSLLQLALIHERGGEHAKAERLWERVKRAQTAPPAPPAGNDRGAT